MKKRIVCAMLALIMLVGLVPLSASAASHTTSEAAITVIKQLNKFEDSCSYYNGTVFHTGYGTVCEEKHHFNTDGTPKISSGEHTITQPKADKALRTYLVELDAKINGFASSNGLSLSQNQHDALVVFTFNEGDAWLNGTGVLKSVIVKGGSTQELLNAMDLWGNMPFRKVEVNMYVNGIYSNTLTGNFATVTYHAEGGTMAQSNGTSYGDTYTMYYDTTEGGENIPVPTRKGYKFVGWYTAADQGAWKASGVVKNGDLYAVWQKNGLKASSVKAADLTEVDYKTYRSKLASTTMYSYPTVKSTEKGTVTSKTNLTVTHDFIDSNDVRWSRLSNGYWVKIGTPDSTAAEGTVIDFEVTVTVTNSYVNRRTNATALSAKNGTYNQGDQLLIISEDGGWGQVGEKDADGVVTAVGWVALQYTNWDSVNEGATSSSNNTTPIATAIVTVNGYLNIRADAGTDGKIVGALAKDDVVDLFEIKTANGHQWGRTKSGWICLTYTKTTLKDGVTVSDAGIQAYTFIGKAESDCYPRVEAGSNTNSVGTKLAAGTKVTITNLTVAEGYTWGKVTWYVDTDKDGKTDTAKSGWVKLSDPLNLNWTGDIKLNPAKFSVAADKMNVRQGPGDNYDLVSELNSVNKGVQMEVTRVYLVNENIWGRVTVQYTAKSGKVGTATGYINLASKYVTRDDSISLTPDQNISKGLMGTVINTNNLRVRDYGATYGGIIGSLSQGDTVAVWEENEDGWYKVDSNKNGKYDYEDDGWVSGQYLSVYEAKDEEQTVTNNAGQSYTTDGTGMGVVANTYSGVNVRQGAGTGYASVGKLLPGTAVEILEVTTAGASKWGRTAQGWVCMDYIAMISYNEVVNVPEGGVSVDSFENVDKTTTTAVYTGTLDAGVKVYQDSSVTSEVVRTTAGNENITIHELAAVTTSVESDEQVDPDKTTTTTVTTTTYWARINNGWVKDPQVNVSLDALDEKTHTVTGTDKLKVRPDPSQNNDPIDVLVKGDQVTVTALSIEKDKVWGRIETEEGTGWIRLDYTSEGALYLNNTNNNNTNNNANGGVITPPVMGNGSSTGGFVNNTTGYRYTGKVIRTNSLNVRATASDTAAKTTTLSNGQALVIYEVDSSSGMAWGRCDAGWVYLYYVDLTPVTGAVDARVVANENTVIYTDMNCTSTAGTYAKQSVVDIFEIVGKMARTELGWINTDNLL